VNRARREGAFCGTLWGFLDRDECYAEKPPPEPSAVSQHEDIRQQANNQSKDAKDAFSRYERVMLRLLLMKSVTGMRAIIGVVRIKTRLRARTVRFFCKSKENA
jgi:hypothetical protein